MLTLLQTPLQPPDLLNIRVPPAVPPRARETSLNRTSQVFLALFPFFEIMIAICVIDSILWQRIFCPILSCERGKIIRAFFHEETAHNTHYIFYFFCQKGKNHKLEIWVLLTQYIECDSFITFGFN